MTPTLLYDVAKHFQTLTNGFQSVGFKTQTQPLSYFQEDYGLKVEGDDEEDEVEEDDDEEMDELDGEDREI